VVISYKKQAKGLIIIDMKKKGNGNKYYNFIALRTTIIYIVLSALWILFSDRLLLTNPETAIYISTVKGWFYTIIVGVFIYFTLTREINLIQKAEEVIVTEKEKFAAAFHAAPYLMAITDINKGVILEVNEGYSQLLGYSRDESIGKTTSELAIWANPKDRDKFALKLKKYGQINDFETTLKRKDGNIITVIDSARTIKIQNQDCVLSIAYDITERKKAEERLLELDRLKDNFLSVTTHELKTPLTPIKSQSQLLLNGDYGSLNPEQRHAILMIARNEENLNRLISDLMDISKIKSNKLKLILEKIKLNEIINNVIKDVANLTKEKNITLFFEPLLDNSEIIADKLRITQVITNLINNAIKFTSDGGQVNINTKNIDNNVIITIKDTGIGLSSENIQKLFTPFFQVQSNLSRQYRGTGLGLAITKGIIEAHDGKIWVESPGEGQGSSFIFTLPIK
jgi:PAS domain S-box-containing protein